MTTIGLKPSAPAIYSHTGLRGIAAMYVVMFHLGGGETDFQAANAFFQFFHWGGYVVDLFFILSGFILNWVYLSNAIQMNWSSYLRARIARIIPLYYLTIIFCAAVIVYKLVRYGSTYGNLEFPKDYVLNILLLSGIVSGWEHTINVPSWSISVEFFCYLAVFPLLFLLKRFLTGKPYAVPALIVMAGISTLGLVTCYNLAPVPIWHWHWDASWLARGIWGFSTGFFLCSLHQKTTFWKPGGALIDCVFLISIGMFFLVVFKFMPSQHVLYALPFLVFFSATDRGLAAGLLKTKPFQWLGERSYSIYLWHMVCLGSYTYFLHARLSEFGYDLVVLALILGISEMSYRFFECPCREYLRKFPRPVSPG